MACKYIDYYILGSESSTSQKSSWFPVVDALLDLGKLIRLINRKQITGGCINCV